MKISDPLGKVYTHTMFKKKSYDIAAGAGADKDREESDEDGASDISDQSDDSLSTRSSRVETRGRGGSRRTSKEDQDRDQEQDRELDREDAISYESRRRDRSRSGRAKKETKRFGLENLGPPGTSYSLWSAQRSVKRDHRRKFNRSLCGVLLGIRKVSVKSTYDGVVCNWEAIFSF